jgi:hypothetical protein
VVTWAIEPRARRSAGEQGYVVFLLLHVWITLGFIDEHASSDGPLDLGLHAISVVIIVLLLAAYTFAAKWMSFRTTLAITIVWLVLVCAWFLRWFPLAVGFLPWFLTAVHSMLFLSYVWLFAAGLLLKRGPTGIHESD